MLLISAFNRRFSGGVWFIQVQNGNWRLQTEFKMQTDKRKSAFFFVRNVVIFDFISYLLSHSFEYTISESSLVTVGV